VSTKKPKIPVLLYEEPKPGEAVNPIPYIEIEKDGEMPRVLFVSEYKETGEFEADAVHGSVAIVDMLIHKFVDMEHLKEMLDSETNDKVRVALGMKPLKEAQQAGQPILDKIFTSAEARRKELETSQDARGERAFTLGEDLRRKASNFLKDKKEEN
jgi:hypothetical protein